MIRRIVATVFAMGVMLVLAVPDAGALICKDCRYNPRAGRDRCYFTNLGGFKYCLDLEGCGGLGICESCDGKIGCSAPTQTPAKAKAVDNRKERASSDCK